MHVCILTHISLASFLWDTANNAASDQGLQYLLTDYSIKI